MVNDVGHSHRDVLMNGIFKTVVRPLFSSPKNRSMMKLSQKSHSSRSSIDTSRRGDRVGDGRGGGIDNSLRGSVNGQSAGSMPLVLTETTVASLEAGVVVAGGNVAGEHPVHGADWLQEVLGAMPVLLVDDAVSILKMTKRAIQNECANISFMEAKNGEEAFERVLKDFATFELIITDIQMPICGGFEFTRRVRALEQEKELTPKLIIGISANDQPKIAEEAKASGMVLS